MITVVGTVFVDIIGKSCVPFEATGRNIGLVETRYGGVGHNVARNLRFLGKDVTFVSSVENSATGEDIISKLQEAEIHTECVYRCEKGMGIWHAILDDKGELAASISQQPDFSFLAQKLKDDGEQIFAESSAVALEVDLTEEIAEICTTWAKKKSIPVYAVVSNLSVAKARPDVLSCCDMLVVNKLDASHLLELPCDCQPDFALSEGIAKKYGINKAVVTMGEFGSQSFSSADGYVSFQPALETEIVDVSGAGDAFYSGAVCGIINGKKLHDACPWGTKTASLTIANSQAVCSEIRKLL